MNCCNKEYFSHIHKLFKCVNWAFISKIAGVSEILATSVNLLAFRCADIEQEPCRLYSLQHIVTVT